MDMSSHEQSLANAVRGEDFDLRTYVKTRSQAPHVQLGLRHAPDFRPFPKLDLADYVSDLAEPPAAVHRSHMEFNWGMLMNDQLGDCGPVMAIHGNEAFHLDAGTPVPPFGDPQAEAFYEMVGGYVPGNPSTDQGVDNQVLVDDWRDKGILDAAGKRHYIAGSVWVDPQDERLSKIGIWEFVVLFRAVGLPTTAQGQTYWKVTDPTLQGDAAVGSWGYHDIPYLSYDNRRTRNVTWGDEYLVDWAFDTAYAVQGFVVVTQEQLSLRGVSPSGLNWTQLNADLAKLPPRRS